MDRSTLVGSLAPEFDVKAAVNNQITNEFSLKQFRGKNVILFFYPLDFTFVDPTELHAFQEKLDEFQKQNTVLILMADIDKSIAKGYGLLHEEEGAAYRGLFLIDTEGIVRHQAVSDLPTGRSVDDALRVLDAWSYF